MKILDELKEKDLMFVEQDFDNVTFYEIYYLGTKLYQCRNKFEEAIEKWSRAVESIANKV